MKTNDNTTNDIYEVVKVFRKSRKQIVLKRWLTQNKAMELVNSYPNSNTSMVIFREMKALDGIKTKKVSTKKNLKGTSKMTTAAKTTTTKKRPAHKTTVKKVSIAKTAVKQTGELVKSLEKTIKSGKAQKKAVLSTISKVKTRVAKAKKSLGIA